MKTFLFGALAIATLGSACTTTESDSVLTKGMYASMSATTDGTGQTTVYASLFLGDPLNLNFVDLVGDDQLVADHDGDMKVMTETTILNIVSHAAAYNTSNEGDEFHVDFQRSVDDGAPDSHTQLPAPFAIDPLPATISRAQAFGVTWDPPTSDLVSYRVSGDCVDEISGSVTDPQTGELDIAANALVLRQGSTVTSCEITVTLEREKDGTVDSHFGKGGVFLGIQRRIVKFTSTP